MLGIGVKEATDHALILGVMFCRFLLKEVDAAFAQCQSDLHSFVPEHQVFWGGKKVWDHLGLTQRFIRVFYFRAHRVAFPSANNRRQRCE